MIPEWVFQLPMNIIKSKAEDCGVEPELLAAICWQESKGFVYAVRYEPEYRWTYRTEKFARMQRITQATEEKLQMQSYGLSQVMGGTARWLGFSGPLPTLYKPENNLYWAAKYLKNLSQRWDKTTDIMAAYNAGTVVKTSRGLYKNQKYVDSVLTNYKQLKNIK